VGVSGNTAKAQRTATVSVKTGNLTKTIAVTQSGLSAPTVTTLSATNITQSTATLNKSVTAGTESITAQGFEYRIENATTWIRSISGSLTGLAAGTTYEFRAYAVTATATTYGAVLTFKTLAIIPPTVTTLSAANITQTTAVLNKSVAAGTETVTAQGFEYRKQGAASSWITSTTGNLTNLAENTAYEFRAYAVTASGTTYGATLIFNTLAISPPGIKTQPATAITSSSATLNKSIVAGSEVIIEQGFEYRALNGPKWYVSSSGNLTGLIAGTTYEFRAYAVTASGTTYGTILTFNTLSISAPTVTTLAASNITQTTATLNKSVSAGTEAISSQGFEYRKQGAASWNTSSSGTLANLTENTTYEYRAYAVTASGTFYGDVMTFTTKGVANDLCADATSLIFGTFVSGTLVGSTPSAIYSNYGWLGDVFYQFTPAYTGDYTVTLTKLLLSDDIDVIVYRGCNSTTEVASISANGITETVTFNCTAGTDYRLRVVITGITNGGFKIKVDSPPTVTTQSATDITLTTAILHKSVTAGSEAISSQGFEYRKQGSSNWSASVSGNLANLTENTTYEYRAYAVTASGTTYGTTLTFKTLTDPGTTGTTFGNNVVTSLNYGGGNGTQGSPFLINNVGQLKKLVEDLDTREKYYKLMNDIYVTTNDWTPIGINAVFEGYFDGNGHKITGALTSSRHVKFGFFLEILKGTVSNLAIDATVKNTGTFSANNTYTGSIAAYATDGATITACSFTGSLTGGNITAGYTGGSYTGGIVGEMISCYVNNCTVNAQVISGRSTESRTGGIFAGGQDHAISNCTVSGSIIGSPESSLSTCGGILGGAGCYNGCEHSIVNCTNNASVSGHDAGGIAGVLHDHAGIHSCLNTGNVSCYEGGLAGGIVGNQTFENYVNSCNTNRGLVNGQQPDEHNLLGGGTLGGGISYSRQCPENHTKR
jgi:hypothetical protein